MNLQINGADIITVIINQYIEIFSGYYNPFLNWGKWLFFSFAVIALVWLCLWRAFDKQSVTDAMPGFLKEFFLMALFYTIMINAAPWLSSIVDTAQGMGQQLTHQQIDPASIIQQGLTIANQILAPSQNSGATALSMGTTLMSTAYLITLAAFIAVAINLAMTLLITTFFISLSGLCLAFGAFNFTRIVARRTLDTVVAYSFKLLTLYLVISAGSGIFIQLSNYLPHDNITSFDAYGWTIAAALLFCTAAYYLPRQVTRLFTNAFHEQTQATDCSASPSPPLVDAKLALDHLIRYSPTPLHISKSTHELTSKPGGYHEHI